MLESLSVGQASLEFYQLPFKRKFNIAGMMLTSRPLMYLNVLDNQGIRIISEIAPLESYSLETFKKAQHQAQEIVSLLPSQRFPLNKDELLIYLSQQEWLLHSSSSVRFGVESALLQLAAQRRGLSLLEFLGGHYVPQQTAALLQGNAMEIFQQAREYYNRGYRVFKLKVGNRNITFDVINVNRIRSLGDDVLIRLDANRQWKLDEALCFVDLIGKDQIDFIEEPLMQVDQLDQFYRQTTIPVGLDETLLLSPSLASVNGVRMWVLKPMLLGLVKTLEWIAIARRYQKRWMISSCFESIVGLSVLAQLSCLSLEAPGLGTALWLEDTQDFLANNGLIRKI